VARVSTLDHWESYWKGHSDIENTYSTGDRLVREVLADGPVTGAPVLEVGAGSGRDLLGLVRAGGIGVVLDYSPASLAIVQRLAREQGLPVHLVQADALAMPFRDDTFQVVFHQGLLEHFRDPLPLMKENARITRRGGRVVVDVPQTFHLYTAMKQVLIAFERWFAGWETQFTPAELERVCRASGLRCAAPTATGWCRARVPGAARGLKRGFRSACRSSRTCRCCTRVMEASARPARQALGALHLPRDRHGGRESRERTAVTCWRSTSAIPRIPRPGARSCISSTSCARRCARATA
jgi:ubiquinone/menaquinone biosynthesis C-methylase UbiE